MSALIEARDLSLARGGRTVVTIAALDVHEGESLAILGPNGAGKSTLLQALALLLPPERGTLRFRGAAIGRGADPVAARREMAVVFQRPLLLDRDVLANVELGLALRGVARAARRERALRALARVAATHLASRHARALSGGEAQRVSLARALALEPAVLFFDEPFAALDAPTREVLVADLVRALHDSRTTSVFVTHDRDEALSLGDRVAVLIDGQLRQLGPADEVFRAPADLAVASFVGVESVLPARVVSSDEELTVLRVGERLVEVTATPPPGDDFPLLCIGPEEVTIALEAIGTSSVRNRFAATVTNVEPIGRRVRVTLDCGFPLVAHVTRASARELGLASGTAVTASFKATAPHLLPRRRAAASAVGSR